MMLLKSLLLLLAGISCACACVDFDANDFVQGTEGAIFQDPRAQARLGNAVSSAGDVNGDGLDDFIVTEGSYFSDSRVFLVFGRNESQWAATASAPTVFASPSADPSSYVAFQPRAGCQYLSYESLSFGDINGDGFSDILLGSYNDYGCGFAIFGHSGAWDALITAGEAPGMTFDDEYDNWGQYPIGCGDINNDGIEDVLVATYEGIPFVVFGDSSITNTEHVHFNISFIDGTNGFVLTDYPTEGYFSYGYTGRAGDVNGDGIEDLLIGHNEYDFGSTSNVGRAYVLFGRSSWTATVSVSDAAMDGTHGFIINPPPTAGDNFYMGWHSMGAGDLNHDGFADIFLSTSDDMGYIVFGASTWGPTFNVADLDGTNGFTLQGDGTTTSNFGYSGGPAGDVNGDHVDDLVFSDSQAYNDAIQSGAAWVLYGHRGDWPATITRSDIIGTVGFEIAGTDTINDNFGNSAKGAGDVNGDGFPDIIIGAPYRNSGYGEAYLVFSNAVEGCLECNETEFCMHCAQGFFLETDGTCTDCSLTNSWSVNDTEICQTCVMNGCLECDAGSGICTKCPAGTGINDTAPVTCDLCTSTQFSPDGTQCDACLLGFGCISCNATNGLCIECPAGMHLDGVSCEDCGDMQWSAGGSAAACSVCQVDAACEECDSRTGHCTSCPVAHGLADSGCTACGGTQFSDGKHACAACELQDGCSACDRTTGMCIACPAGTGLQGVGCVACTPTRFVVDGYCSPCALDDGCIACDPVTGACVDCPGDMVPTGTGCKPFEVASNATKDDDDNVSMAAKPTTNALHLIASIIVSAIAAAAMATF